MITKIKAKWAYTQKMIWINRCFFIIKHRTLYKQTTNKNFFMFRLVLYLTQNIFSRDSKFISSLEEWTSRALMNNVIDDSLNRWHLKKFIKNHKNEVTSSDCLKHFHKMRIQECHLAKQHFACIIKSIIVRLVFSSLRSAIFEARRLIV